MEVSGHTVQRDLYSAFLIKKSDLKLEHPDRDKCTYGFQKFLQLHETLLQDMKENRVTLNHILF